VLIIALYFDLYSAHGMKGCSDEHVADHRHVERMNAEISSLQLDFCTLTDAFIITVQCA